eukprot:Rmarinus@m.23594
MRVSVHPWRRSDWKRRSVEVMPTVVDSDEESDSEGDTACVDLNDSSLGSDILSDTDGELEACFSVSSEREGDPDPEESFIRAFGFKLGVFFGMVVGGIVAIVVGGVLAAMDLTIGLVSRYLRSVMFSWFALAGNALGQQHGLPTTFAPEARSPKSARRSLIQ